VVILGDVNPGAEVVAGGDVIVMGALRGVVHAGAGGNPDAIVWAKPIASPQIRLADALARAPEGNSLSSMRKVEGQAEIARLHDGAIVIEAHGPVRRARQGHAVCRPGNGPPYCSSRPDGCSDSHRLSLVLLSGCRLCEGQGINTLAQCQRNYRRCPPFSMQRPDKFCWNGFVQL
jgi:Septum formation inhibitor MinC, C-terminal domain